MADHETAKEEEMFKLYFELDGNIHAMLSDTRCFFKTYVGLYEFCGRHKFKERLDGIRTRAREMTNEELSAALVIKRKEIIAIARAVFAKYAEQLSPTRKERLSDGTVIEVPNERMTVTSSDVLVAYKIFKTEMSEAQEINRHEFSTTLKGENIFEHFQKRAREEQLRN